MKSSLVILLLALITFVEAKKPNIILIESDDQTNLAVGAYGFGKMITPNIDKLANEGVYFTNAYNMGCWSPAVCIPSRTMLFNGQYLWKASKTTKDRVPGPNMAERLTNAGYDTYFTGKWHAWGHNPKQSFKHVGTITAGQLKTFWGLEGHMTDVVGKEAVNFVKKAAKKEKPFFLYVAFNAPHVPRQTEEHYYAMYPKKELLLPPSVKDGPLNKNVKYQYAPDPMTCDMMRGRYQQNNAMVTHMDERIGDILSELEKHDLYKDAIVIFMSDHGISFGENGVAGKVCLYDVSVKAPLIIKGPEVKRNTKFHERLYLQDIYPTILDFAQVKKPDYMEFHSLKDIVYGKQGVSPYSSIYLAMFNDQRSIIHNNYKLILYPVTQKAELYNLEKDPWETNNKIKEPALASTKKALVKEFVQWQKQAGDTLDLAPRFPELFN